MNWRNFLKISAEYLAKDPCPHPGPPNWCSWTTFTRLRTDAGYWTCPLPEIEELGNTSTIDGGTWMQPIRYDDLAHVIIPKEFFGRQTLATVIGL